MAEDLDLSLPQRSPVASPKAKAAPTGLLVLLLLAVLVNIGLTLRGPSRPSAKGRQNNVQLAVDPQRKLALRLEKQQLNVPAAQAWQQYLRQTDADDEKAARIWYRIGTLHQQEGNYVEALDAFYRSEGFAALGEIEDEIGRRAQECLEALGKFAALRYELAGRVGADDETKASGEDVVAEIGAHKITEAHLDHAIESMIENQLRQFAAHLPEEQLHAQKEAFLKRFTASRERLQLLNQIVMEEVLYRKARATALHDAPDVQRMLRDTERKILAQKLIEKRMSEQIKITPGDVQTYFEANRDDYVQPERAKVNHILLDDQEKAEAALTSLREGKSFADLAKGISADEATAKNGGEITGWIEKGSQHIPGLGAMPEAVAAIIGTEPDMVVEQPFKSDKGFHVFMVREREPERRKDFDEVRQHVQQALRQGKEVEVQQQLLAELKKEFDVVIHFAKFSDAGDGEKKDTAAP